MCINNKCISIHSYHTVIHVKNIYWKIYTEKIWVTNKCSNIKDAIGLMKQHIKIIQHLEHKLMKIIFVTPIRNLSDTFKVMSVTLYNLCYVKNTCYDYFKVIKTSKELARVTDNHSRCLFSGKSVKTTFWNKKYLHKFSMKNDTFLTDAH